MERHDSVYFQHILDAISRIDEYVHGVNEETFYQQYLVRDKVIHDYFVVDLDAVRLTVRDHIPALKADVARMLEES